ncbi:GNAT family N-acetyltransferase [Streptomyces sp. C]|uniref:GNAT family N-acetyltransferase n=1 Tax=Streptomyces sp. C TaxID=253839 RepID=UPI0001DEF042|nr:GNAT family N-acetyltransferase [Streptomyces sp. C]EFL16485.1 acetyltransferase [Streptomyces sp. C]
MNQHVIRSVRADEWQKVKELRLAALSDPAASMAFLETVEQAAAKPDAFWQDRAAGAAEGVHVRQFVAEAPDGRWDGSVTVFVEAAGDSDFLEQVVEADQGHVVGVFVRPEQRGSGLTDALFAAALEWVWARKEPVLDRVRLFVHGDNERAAGFYRRFGFRASGLVIPKPGDPTAKEHEYVIARP